RLRQVVVRAAVEPGDAIFHRISGRQNQDGYGRAALAQLAADLQPIGARQEDVEHDRVVVGDGGLIDGGITILDYVNSVRVLAQSFRKNTGGVRLVFDQENAHCFISYES